MLKQKFKVEEVRTHPVKKVIPDPDPEKAKKGETIKVPAEVHTVIMESVDNFPADEIRIINAQPDTAKKFIVGQTYDIEITIAE